MKQLSLNKLSRFIRKQTIKLAMLTAAVFFSGNAMAQTTISLGNGTGTSTYTPIATYFGYSYSQSIYTVAELQAAGGVTGSISKVRFFYSGGPKQNSRDWSVYLGHTNKSAFANGSDWQTSGLTNCFTGQVTFPAAGNWMEITLTTPFVWNGQQNIVVSVDENQGGFSDNPGAAWRITNTQSSRTLYYVSDGNNPNPLSPPPASQVASYVNVQLVLTPFQNCSGTPVAANVMMQSDTLCPGTASVLSLDQNYQLTGITYQWQRNAATGWANIPAATSATYTTPALFQSGEYRAIVGCSLSGLADTTDAEVITVQAPTVTLNISDVVNCQGEPANVIASGALTYAWFPNTALTPGIGEDSVYLSPTNVTNYRVIGTDAYGCKDTAFVKVTPLNKVKAVLSYDPTKNCAPGSEVTMAISGLPEVIAGGGQWQVLWKDAGLNIVQDWDTDSSYSFIPAADSIYGHYYRLRSTSCPANPADSVYTSIAIGFGADETITDFDCNTNGIIQLSNVFGQESEFETFYQNTFATGSGMTNIELWGAAEVAANRLVLTPSQTSSLGYAILTVPGQRLGQNNAMKVSFNMTNDTPINNWDTGGADGLTYSFGDDASPFTNGSSPNGHGTKLRLCFDSAANGENDNQPGIYLVYGWTSYDPFGPGNAQTLYYSNNISSWKTLTDVPVVFEIDGLGKARLTVNGELIFSGVQLPGEYTTANTSGWKHMFSAGTGGDALRQAVSNLKIETIAINYGITQSALDTPEDWQIEKKFEDLLPGSYYVWISADTTGSCARKLGPFVIANDNPVVDLGGDATICEGDTLVLDAGNPGSDYTWSGTNEVSQTLEVTEAGLYSVYVTSPAGCLGIGTVNVDVLEAPSVDEIFSNGTFPTVFFSASNAQNTDSYFWNFGDGESLANGPVSVAHTYEEDGTYTVSLIVRNDCGSDTVTTSVTITDYSSLSENGIEGLEVYPNPAFDKVTIKVANSKRSEVKVVNVTGQWTLLTEAFTGSLDLNVASWDRGVYFLLISNEGKTTVSKLIVK